MNKIVREHYPAARLPDDLRAGIDPNARVTITVEMEDASGAVMSLEDMFAMRRDVFFSKDEVDNYVKSLREEWER